MIKVAVVGYGNIGKYAVQSVNQAPDMELAGVVRRNVDNIPEELEAVKVVSDIDQLGPVDVALLCTPTRLVPKYAKELLAKGINTIDSYDIHGASLAQLRKELAEIGRAHNSVAVISAGWDPGTDSMVRGIMELSANHGITYTDFGPGMSMGHSVAVKALDGVTDALSLTIPVGTGIHRRMVYVQLDAGAVFDQVEQKIKSDPYFVNDETHVFEVPDVRALIDMGHGVSMERKAVSGETHNQMFKWEMRINNPALTAQVMTAAGRASVKQQPGAYTTLQIPIINFLPGDEEEIIKRMV